MRLLVESDLKPAGGIVGAGADEFRWPRPVRPGDELRIESEVLEVRPSRSRPDQGLIKVRTTTLNQHDEAVQVIIADRKSTRLNSSHLVISYAVFCLKKKKNLQHKCLNLISSQRACYNHGNLHLRRALIGFICFFFRLHTSRQLCINAGKFCAYSSM